MKSRSIVAGLVLAAGLAASAIAQEGSEPPRVFSGVELTALMQRLEAEDWVPPYFAGRVRIFDPDGEQRRLREMLGERYSLVQAGRYEYRTSPRRVEQGARLFSLYDFGSAEQWRNNERYMFYALGVDSIAQLGSRYGIGADPEGKLVGIVGMPKPDGRIDYGWSCALCHAGPGPDGRPIPGAPNHLYDLGAIRYRGLMEHDPRPAHVGPGFIDRDIPVERLPALGPGRHDQNADRVANPVKVPSLWGLRAVKTGFFASGGIDNLWFALGGHNHGVHPPSAYVEALVAYVLSLEPPPNPRPKGEAESRGERIFGRAGCASCHSGPYYTSGEMIAVDVIGTDPARVKVDFPKGYRVPTLRRLDLARLYLHDGSIKSLPDLFSRSRLATVKGHEYGLDLTDREVKDLVAFLLSL